MEKRESDKKRNSFKDSSKGYVDVESQHGEYRFKIGVIDFLTKYSNLKYLENQTKAKLAGVDNKEISAIDPETYQKRFVTFMSDNI